MVCFLIDYTGVEPPLYYWRDSQGHEVDLLVEDGETLYPLEIKSGQTVNSFMFDGLNYWNKLVGTENGMLCYGGSASCTRNGIWSAHGILYKRHRKHLKKGVWRSILIKYISFCKHNFFKEKIR